MNGKTVDKPEDEHPLTSEVSDDALERAGAATNSTECITGARVTCGFTGKEEEKPQSSPASSTVSKK